MKEILTQYAEYNIWANKLVIDAMLAMPVSAATFEINSSFPTLLATAQHTSAAEDIWCQRLMNVAQPTWTGEAKFPFNEVCDNWEIASQAIATFIATQDETSLQSICTYSDRRGNPYTTPVWQVLHHVFNHSTYHRGQLITMMRQAGASQVPGTDFIGFVRISK